MNAATAESTSVTIHGWTYDVEFHFTPGCAAVVGRYGQLAAPADDPVLEVVSVVPEDGAPKVSDREVRDAMWKALCH